MEFFVYQTSDARYVRIAFPRDLPDAEREAYMDAPPMDAIEAAEPWAVAQDAGDGVTDDTREVTEDGNG